MKIFYCPILISVLVIGCEFTNTEPSPDHGPKIDPSLILGDYEVYLSITVNDTNCYNPNFMVTIATQDSTTFIVSFESIFLKEFRWQNIGGNIINSNSLYTISELTFKLEPDKFHKNNQTGETRQSVNIIIDPNQGYTADPTQTTDLGYNYGGNNFWIL